MRPLSFLALVLPLVACGRTHGVAPAASPVAVTDCGAVVGFIDVDAIVTRTVEGPMLEKAIKVDYDARQKTLDERQARLEKMRAELEANTSTLSKDELAKRAEVFQRELLALQELYVSDQKALDEAATKRAEAARARVRAFVTTHTGELGHPEVVAVTDGRALWAKPTCSGVTVDLTDAVVSHYKRDDAM